MTLIELSSKQEAQVISVTACPEDEERLHAIGVYIGSVLTKLEESSPRKDKPVCIATDARSVFAISRSLAATIKIRPL